MLNPCLLSQEGSVRALGTLRKKGLERNMEVRGSPLCPSREPLCSAWNPCLFPSHSSRKTLLQGPCALSLEYSFTSKHLFLFCGRGAG